MACNCYKIVVVPAAKFGSCALCLQLTLAGFICSWLLALPSLFIPMSATLLIALSLPAALFTVWLALHVAAAAWHSIRRTAGGPSNVD